MLSFVEKYRPKSFDEVVGLNGVIEVLKEYIDRGSIPNLLFAGKAGTGKTTLAYVLAREFLGESYKHSFLELNASDERGIDVVRGKIKEFARTTGFHDLKIIFLDEASEITKDAQHALRRIMEVYHKNCRFILSCNYIEKVIVPIKSRCQEFIFNPLTKSALLGLAKKVVNEEGIEIKKRRLKLLVLESGGDARRLLNLLESFVCGQDIEEYEDRLDDLLNLDVQEFVELVYLVDNERMLNLLIEQSIKIKNRKVVVALADCDMRFRLGCIKSLQLISVFLKIKNEIGG